MDRISQPATPLNAKSVTSGADQYRHPQLGPTGVTNGANTPQVSRAGHRRQAPDMPLRCQVLSDDDDLGRQVDASASLTNQPQPADGNPSAEQEHNFAPERNPHEYTVVRGDNLWKIARRDLHAQALDVSAPSIMTRIKEIIEANKDKYPALTIAPNLVKDGWKLSIPADNPTEDAPVSLPSPEDSFGYWQCVANRL